MWRSLGRTMAARVDGVPRVRTVAAPGGPEVVIAAPDRLGLFGETAGLLTASGASVRAAVLHTVDRVAVTTWRVSVDTPDDLPDPAVLVTSLQRLQGGDATVLARVRRREDRGQPADQPEPYLTVLADASDSAAVVEVRTADRPGLLYALGLGGFVLIWATRGAATKR